VAAQAVGTGKAAKGKWPCTTSPSSVLPPSPPPAQCSSGCNEWGRISNITDHSLLHQCVLHYFVRLTLIKL
jgi:hypothetical protein